MAGKTESSALVIALWRVGFIVGGVVAKGFVFISGVGVDFGYGITFVYDEFIFIRAQII
jgi:hypothetical protein